VRILAVDTALGACSVAILQNDQVLAHSFDVMERGHAEALAPMVEAAMKNADCEFASLERLAVTVGPGTFTGQRVGLAFMRAMRIALGIPLVGVTTLSAMAHQAMAETQQAIGAGLHDARRNEFYVEIAGAVQLSPCVLSFEDAVGRLTELSAPFVLAGTAAARAHAHLPSSVLSGVRQPDALWVAKLAHTSTPSREPPRPLYLRPPDAKLPALR
jgi:tRNA threonylcarbamoyladenosine biosynthesis protein TsaB